MIVIEQCLDIITLIGIQFAHILRQGILIDGFALNFNDQLTTHQRYDKVHQYRSDKIIPKIIGIMHADNVNIGTRAHSFVSKVEFRQFRDGNKLCILRIVSNACSPTQFLVLERNKPSNAEIGFQTFVI